MISNFKKWSLADTQTALDAKKISASELADVSLRVVEKDNKKTNAFIGIFENVRAQANEADKRLANGDRTPFLGVPIAIKDNMLFEGEMVSAGSKILDKYRAPYTATALRKLRELGAVIIGRTNMDEFAMGSSTEHSAYGVTKNPHDYARVPGGSSGGSAVAVSEGIVPVSLGSDTGGSIRQPAGFCGCVGLKPTYGAVSRYGLIALGSSLDQIGTFGKKVLDTEALFNAIRGIDKNDSTTLPGKYWDKNKDTKTKLTIGVPRHFLKEGMDDDVLSCFDKTLDLLRNSGHEVRDISLSNVHRALAAYYIIMPAEASTNLARFDGMRYGPREKGHTLLEEYKRTRGGRFGKEVRRRIMLGTYVLSSGYYDAYYGKAQTARRMIQKEFAEAFASVDVIATPTSPTPAFLIGEKSDPMSMYLADIFTVPANIAGIPGISVPMGVVDRNKKMLPVGIQFLGPIAGEKLLFEIGKKVESTQ